MDKLRWSGAVRPSEAKDEHATPVLAVSSLHHLVQPILVALIFPMSICLINDLLSPIHIMYILYQAG